MKEPRQPDARPPATVPIALSTRRLADRFEIVRWLGEGGMGTVYLARDIELERRVALKVLLGAEPDALARFKREFRVLADLSHPNLIVLHELFCDEGTWLFSMDYVEGRDFLTHVSALDGRDAPTLLEVEAHRGRDGTRRAFERPRCPLRDEAMLKRVLVQLVDATCHLHAADKLHLDLKPSNVLVSASGHVTVLDFGLARDLAQMSQQSSAQRLLGTPAYMAPEHAEGGKFGPASDWYAVGVMLYEALSGRLPFEGAVADILLSKVRLDPPPPRTLASDVPAELEALCMALLVRDPEARPSGVAILAALGASPAIARAAQRAKSVGDEPFVGRAEVLESLGARAAGPRHPRVVLLHGGSGVGKTTLARRFLDQLATRPRTLVLRGACYEREALPFKAFDGVVDALIKHLKALSPLELGALMPRHAHTLSQLFPAFASLAPAPPVQRSDDDEPGLGRARAFRAFAELFGRLSDQRDVVLFIDDLQWSDVDSALLLRALFEGPEPVPLLLVGAYRPERAVNARLLEELRELASEQPALVLEDAAVGALDQAEAAALASALLRRAGGHEGAHDDALSRQIAAESQGVPLFIHELVRAALREDAPHGRAITLQEVLAARIATLSSDAAHLLDVLAVAGGPLPQRVAYRAAEMSARREAALHTLRVAGLAKSHGAGLDDRVDTAHDRVRAAVLRELPGAARAAVHARLLAAFERESTEDEEQLFMHSLGAGQRARALVHVQRAAARARGALGFHRSAELYRVALTLLEAEAPDDRARRTTLLAALAETLAASGYCLDAAHAYLDAAEQAEPDARATLERNAANQLLRGGELVQGTALLRRVLERVGVRYPSGQRSALALLAFERARLFARGLGFTPTPPDQIDARALERLEALRVALGVYWLVEPVRGPSFATLYLREALDAGHARHVLRGLENEAAYVALMDGVRGEPRASELYAMARALTQRIGTKQVASGYKIAEAGFHAIYGRKQRSIDCALEALRAPGSQGPSWEQDYARFHVYQGALYVGGAPGLADEIQERVRDAETRKARFGQATLLPMLAMARMMSDEPARAHEAMERMRPLLSDAPFGFLEVQELIWSALSYQYAGRPEAALARYEERAQRYALSGMPRLSTWRLLHHWGKLLAHLGALEAGLEPLRHRKDAARHIEHIERERLAWPMPFASMGRAALAHVEGDVPERDRALGRAIAQADGLGYRPFSALFTRSAALLAGDAARAAEEDARLKILGVACPARWQRTWAPCLGPRA